MRTTRAGEGILRARAQPRIDLLALRDEAGARLVDVGEAPVAVDGDQREDRIAGLDDGAQLLVPLDDDRVVGRSQRAMAQHRLLELELRPRIGELRLRTRDLALGHDDVGLGHGLVACGLLRHLLRDDVATDERLLAPVGLLLLGQHGPRLLEIGLAPA